LPKKLLFSNARDVYVEELTNTSFLDVLLTIFPERLIDNSIKMMM
jgi:hypothetical protein